MDMWQILRIIVRRWYFFLPICILGVAVAIVTTSGAIAQYTATIDAFVHAPASQANQLPGSVERSGGVNFAGSLEQSAMDSDDIRRKIEGIGLRPDYKIKWDRAELTLAVQVSGSNPDVVRKTAEQVVAEANLHLTTGQAKSGVTNKLAQYTIHPSAEGANVSRPSYPGQTRQRILAGVLSLVVAVGVAVAGDGVLTARRQLKRVPVPTPPTVRATTRPQRPVRDDLPYVDAAPAPHVRVSSASPPQPAKDNLPHLDHDRKESTGPTTTRLTSSRVGGPPTASNTPLQRDEPK